MEPPAQRSFKIEYVMPMSCKVRYGSVVALDKCVDSSRGLQVGRQVSEDRFQDLLDGFFRFEPSRLRLVPQRGRPGTPFVAAGGSGRA